MHRYCGPVSVYIIRGEVDEDILYLLDAFYQLSGGSSLAMKRAFTPVSIDMK